MYSSIFPRLISCLGFPIAPFITRDDAGNCENILTLLVLPKCCVTKREFLISTCDTSKCREILWDSLLVDARIDVKLTTYTPQGATRRRFGTMGDAEEKSAATPAIPVPTNPAPPPPVGAFASAMSPAEALAAAQKAAAAASSAIAQNHAAAQAGISLWPAQLQNLNMPYVQPLQASLMQNPALAAMMMPAASSMSMMGGEETRSMTVSFYCPLPVSLLRSNLREQILAPAAI